MDLFSKRKKELYVKKEVAECGRKGYIHYGKNKNAGSCPPRQQHGGDEGI